MPEPMTVLLPALRRASSFRSCLGLLALTLLGGCSDSGYWLFDPRGPVSRADFVSLLIDVAVMMLIIGPTTLMVMWVIYRYRRSRSGSAFQPNWSHSLPIEILSWGVPALTVAFLGYFSYRGVMATNPFGPGVIAHGPDRNVAPVDIDVITTDWQWLFIYPDKHIASANELVIPVHTPIRFRLTSSTVTNAIYIPQLVGQIDIMPGMRTRQALIANEIGDFAGYTGDFNGPGFAWMRFNTHVVSRQDFAAWEAQAASSPEILTEDRFNRFAQPTINVDGITVQFSHAQDHLFDRVIDQVMMGRLYTTPDVMTEKKSYRTDGGRQPTHGEPTPSSGSQ